jgi:hypothetical protein
LPKQWKTYNSQRSSFLKAEEVTHLTPAMETYGQERIEQLILFLFFLVNFLPTCLTLNFEQFTHPYESPVLERKYATKCKSMIYKVYFKTIQKHEQAKMQDR